MLRSIFCHTINSNDNRVILAKFIEEVKTMKPTKAFNKPIAVMVTAILITGTGLQIVAAGKNTPVGKVLR